MKGRPNLTPNTLDNLEKKRQFGRGTRENLDKSPVIVPLFLRVTRNKKKSDRDLIIYLALVSIRSQKFPMHVEAFSNRFYQQFSRWSTVPLLMVSLFSLKSIITVDRPHFTQFIVLNTLNSGWIENSGPISLSVSLSIVEKTEI